MKGLARFFVWVVVVPWIAYRGLTWWLVTQGGPTVMLGATSGATHAALVSMGLAVVLRFYLLVILPPWLAYWLVRSGLRTWCSRSLER